MPQTSAQVAETLRRFDLLKNTCSVVIAISGGPDSVALLRLMVELSQKKADLRVRACHVNHQMRGGESDQDELFVRDLCSRLTVPLNVYRCPPPESGEGNLEQLLRQRRYGRLTLEAARFDSVIATGHTMDDVAETLLLKLARGAGLDGLGAVYPNLVTDEFEGLHCRLIRPLIDLTREDILKYLGELGQDFRQDRTNLELQYDRNWVRHVLLPCVAERLNRRLTETLARTAEILRDGATHLKAEAKSEFAHLCIDGGEGGLDLGRLSQLSRALQREIVRLLIEVRRGHLRGIRFDHIEGVLLLGEGRSGRSLSLPGGWEARREFDALLVSPQAQASRFCYELAIPGQVEIPEIGKRIGIRDVPKGQAGLNRFRFDGERILVRNRQTGDRCLLRNGRQRKLKELFQEVRIPSSQRDELVILEGNGEILWVEGLEDLLSDRSGQKGNWWELSLEKMQLSGPV